SDYSRPHFHPVWFSRSWQPPLLAAPELDVRCGGRTHARQPPRSNTRLVWNDSNAIFSCAGGAADGISPGGAFQAILQVSAIDVRDCQKLVRLEACAADQRAVDLGNTHQFLGIGGLDRSAVEDAR